MASLSPPPSSHGDSGISQRNACLNCRKRKIRCDPCDDGQPTCAPCLGRGWLCEYKETRKKTVDADNLELLRYKAREYDALMSRSLGLDVAEIPAQSYREDFETDEPLLEPISRLSLVNTRSSFKGPASCDTFLRFLSTSSGFDGDDTMLEHSSNFYAPNIIPSRRRLPRTPLPVRDFALRLFLAQYIYIGTIFAFSNPKENFERLLNEVYDDHLDLRNKESCLRYAKFLATIALGQIYSVNEWIPQGPPGFGYLSDAVGLLPEPHEGGSILAVETLALVGYAFHNMNDPAAGFMYIGMALQMAKSLGLHQEVSGHMDEQSREHRRRLWWSIYSLERIVSIKSGNPITIQDDDIGVQLPSPLSGEDDTWAVTVLYHYTKLSRTLGEIHTAIYPKIGSNEPRKSGQRLMKSVQDIMAKLSKWKRDLPEKLAFDPAYASNSRESERLKLIHSGCGVEAKEHDWKTDRSPSTINVIEKCIDGAKDVIIMMDIAAGKNLLATYGYMDGEHVLSATIVLVMVCVALPRDEKYNKAMQMGLNLLYRMATRGNSHMAARHQFLSSVLLAEGVEIKSDSNSITAGGSVNGASPTTPRTLLSANYHGASVAQDLYSLMRETDQFTSGDNSRYQAGTQAVPSFSAWNDDVPMMMTSDEDDMDHPLWEESFANANATFGNSFRFAQRDEWDTQQWLTEDLHD